ncbi:cobalt-precorrin-6A reductase [uncultured Pseudomonas sp.]|uniref:cobalt-precorrin-6A reductase n=1 Tax=uncultured Pseudomonas sp. TaxID=114707 RepID=UPI0025E3DE6B|nr:cobalt-precorrin-6A reductase [uncultured Pseudomonas sp.]
MKILLLGGTTEALAIARTLPAAAIYSLAGLGRVPQDLPCQVRVGGYGGAAGLAAFLHSESIDLLLDATHPYAARISKNAALAAAQAGVPCWALRRPGWQAGADDNWREVADWAELQTALAPFARPFFTLGREPLEHLAEIPTHQFWTLRLLDAQPVAERARIIADRGPFALEAERALFGDGEFDVLISKNSGSAATQPKLQVARERGLPVLILRRPALPTVDREFASVADLLAALTKETP